MGQAQVFPDHIRTVSTDVKGTQVGIFRLQHPCQRGAADTVRHHHVGDQQVNADRTVFPNRQRFRAVSRLEHPVAAAFQCQPGRFPHDPLILDDQHCLARAAVTLGIAAGFADRRRLGFSFPGRQEYFERRAFAHLAGDLDPARVLLHNAMNRGKPQTRAFANFLGCVERVEDAPEDFGAHPATGVRRGQADKPARARFEMVARGRLVEHGQAGDNTDGPTAGHGIPGIQRQVNEDLFHIALVRARFRQVRRAVQFQFVGLADELAERFGQAVDDGGKLDRFELHRLFVAERQQPARQGRCPLARLANACDGFRGGLHSQ